MEHLYSATIKRLEPDTLKKWLLEQKSNLIIVDVRDLDYRIAKLPTAINIPSKQFTPESALESISISDSAPSTTDYSNYTFVFHCMRSQQRGPSCSRKFLRYLLLNTDCKDDLGKLPKIYILDGGLKKWNQLYGDDEKLMIPI